MDWWDDYEEEEEDDYEYEDEHEEEEDMGGTPMPLLGGAKWQRQPWV
jgi:hypothetical protein